MLPGTSFKECLFSLYTERKFNVLDVFETSYVPWIYVLCLGSYEFRVNTNINMRSICGSHFTLTLILSLIWSFCLLTLNIWLLVGFFWKTVRTLVANFGLTFWWIRFNWTALHSDLMVDFELNRPHELIFQSFILSLVLW